MTRYNADLTRDTTFGQQGVVNLTSFTDAYSSGIAVAASGDIYVTFVNSGYTPTHVIHLFPDGSIDTNFGPGGLQTFSTPGTRLILQADGKPIIYSVSGQNIFLIRENADGTPDTSFGQGGQAYADLGGAPTIDSASLQVDGGAEKLLISGALGMGTQRQYYYTEGTDGFIARVDL